jgi:hypothetical protein
MRLLLDPRMTSGPQADTSWRSANTIYYSPIRYFLGRHNDRTTPPSRLKRPPIHRSLKLFADLGRPESETIKLLLSVISRDTINLCRSLRFFHVQIYDINGQSNHYWILVTTYYKFRRGRIDRRTVLRACSLVPFPRGWSTSLAKLPPFLLFLSQAPVHDMGDGWKGRRGTIFQSPDLETLETVE